MRFKLAFGCDRVLGHSNAQVLMGIAALAFARNAASLGSLRLGQGVKPVLLHAAVGSNASPSADYSPVSEQRGLYLDLIKAGEVVPDIVGGIIVDVVFFNGMPAARDKCSKCGGSPPSACP